MKSGISWTDRTWNPVVGCSKVLISSGCDNCWARTMAHVHYPKQFTYREFEKTWWNGNIQCFPERLFQPNHWRKPQKIAVGLMGDIFHPDVPWEFLDQIWAVMGCCNAPDMRHHRFQILTKRPLMMLAYQNYRESVGMVFDLPNLWVGVSVEDQESANIRIQILNENIKAAVKFVSLEPLLSPVKFREVPGFNRIGQDLSNWWMIVGGESGTGARPCDVDWIYSIVNQCQRAHVPVHVKQMGRLSIGFHGKFGDAVITDSNFGNFEYRFKDRNGKDPSEWPEDLRIQEFPRVA
jgi:protein gp37